MSTTPSDGPIRQDTTTMQEEDGSEDKVKEAAGSNTMKFATHVTLFVSAMVECNVTNSEGNAIVECRVVDAKSVRSAFTISGTKVSAAQENTLQHLAAEAALKRTLTEYEEESSKLGTDTMPEFVAPEGGALA